MSDLEALEQKTCEYLGHTITLSVCDSLIRAEAKVGDSLVVNHGKTVEEALDKCKQDLQRLQGPNIGQGL